MSRRHDLPLGVDIGASRIRVSVLQLDAGVPVLRNVAVRARVTQNEDPDSLAAEIRSLLQAEHIREKRAVAAIGEPDATIRTVMFPPMGGREREHAARYEAARFIAYPLSEAYVRIAPLDAMPNAYALGIARNATLRRHLDALRLAGLRVVGIDYEAYAYRRVFPGADAILDVGHLGARLYVYGGPTPFGIALDGGARSFTAIIARSLGLDDAAAERRKRSLGLAGAGDPELSAFARSVGGALLNARNHGAHDVQRIVLVGNGARLMTLAERLERDTGSSVAIADGLGISRSPNAEDIARAGAPDWALSIGIALWSLTEVRIA